MYKSNKCEIYATGIVIIGEINPRAPTRKQKNIVRGINCRIKILAGRDTRENIPVE